MGFENRALMSLDVFEASLNILLGVMELSEGGAELLVEPTHHGSEIARHLVESAHEDLVPERKDASVETDVVPVRLTHGQEWLPDCIGENGGIGRPDENERWETGLRPRDYLGGNVLVMSDRKRPVLGPPDRSDREGIRRPREALHDELGVRRHGRRAGIRVRLSAVARGDREDRPAVLPASYGKIDGRPLASEAPELETKALQNGFQMLRPIPGFLSLTRRILTVRVGGSALPGGRSAAELDARGRLRASARESGKADLRFQHNYASALAQHLCLLS